MGGTGEFGVWGTPGLRPAGVPMGGCAAWGRVRWVGCWVGLSSLGVAGGFGVWGHPAFGPRVSLWVLSLCGGRGVTRFHRSEAIQVVV